MSIVLRRLIAVSVQVIALWPARWIVGGPPRVTRPPIRRQAYGVVITGRTEAAAAETSRRAASLPLHPSTSPSRGVSPAIWISNGTGRDGCERRNAVKVGWCWAGNRHTWLGFASATDRRSSAT